MSVDLHYEINLKFGSSSYSDVGYCCMFKSPLVNLSSFCLISLTMPQGIVRQMVNSVSKNNFSNCQMEIYFKREHTNETISLLFSKPMKVIKVIPDGSIQYQEDQMIVKLILVHPILHYLSNHNTYNKLFFDKTSPQVLEDYEGFLTSKFGDIFHFQKHGDGTHKNEYIYEQILTRAPNDLSIPTYLINNYKTNHSFSYYFFDPFYISIHSPKEITNLFVNMYDPGPLYCENTYNFADMKLMRKQTQMHTFSDIKDHINNKIGNRFILNDMDIRYEHEKIPKQCNLPKGNPSSSGCIILVDEMRGDRKPPQRKVLGIGGGGLTSEQHTSSAITTIYCPDNVANGQTRFNNALGLINNQISDIQYYEMANCHPDFPQLGKIYNLEDDQPRGNKNIAPISITNIFHRKRYKEKYLFHMSKGMYIRYY